MRVLKKRWRSQVTSILLVVVLAACSREKEPQPEVTYEPTQGPQVVTVEPLGTVFTHEPYSQLGLESTSEPGN